MTPTGIVIVLVVVPVALLTFLRANSAMVFLSLCLGQVLVQFVGVEAANTIGIIASDGSTNQSLVSLGLLFVPAIFTTVFMTRTVTGRFRLVLNVLPAISVGVLGLLLAEPLFSDGLRGTLEPSQAWHWVEKTQVIVVGVSAILSLFFLWLQRPKHHKEGKHH